MIPSAASARPAASARRLTGVPILFLSLLVMAPWLALHALLSGTVLGARALGQGPGVLAQLIDYAGGVALRR